MEAKLKIFVCTHKPFYMFKDDILKPIHVGKQLSNLNLGYDGDDTGDHISYKNENYCELTALYWIWKNCKDYDIVGLCHYRRFFHNNQGGNLFGLFYENKLFQFSDFLNLKQLEVLPDEIIVPEPLILNTSVIEHYSIYHTLDDLEIVKEELTKLFPDYTKSFELAMEDKFLYPFNMLVAQRHLIDAYCNWLFPILTNTEQRLKISDDQYQKRVFGFFGERLFTVWLYHNKSKIRCRTLPIVYFEHDIKQIELKGKEKFKEKALGLKALAKTITTKKITELLLYKMKLKISKIKSYFHSSQC